MPTDSSIVWILLVLVLLSSAALGAPQDPVLRSDFESDRVGDPVAAMRGHREFQPA